MSRATLVIMAAGIGSRFGGGIKQLAPIGPNGEIIMDYSVYDAIEAGFDKVVFVIRKDLERDSLSGTWQAGSSGTGCNSDQCIGVQKRFCNRRFCYVPAGNR